MFPGGLKETPYKDMKDRHPDEVHFMSYSSYVITCKMMTHLFIVQIIRHAVSGMLPKNKLRERRLERLKIFPSDRMGILGGNILRSWDDGTLPAEWNPSVPTTSKTLQGLREMNNHEKSCS